MSTLLTIKQVFDVTGVPENTLYYWANAGKLPGAKKLNGSWRVDATKLDKWLDNSEVKLCPSISVEAPTGLGSNIRATLSANQLLQRIAEKQKNMSKSLRSNITA